VVCAQRRLVSGCSISGFRFFHPEALRGGPWLSLDPRTSYVTSYPMA
jgi:hypothetical protein